MIPDDRLDGDKSPRSRPFELEKVGKMVLILVSISLGCALIDQPTKHIDFLRGPIRSLGINLGLIGTGVAAWCGLRFKSRLCDLALLLSIPTIAYWGWVIHQLANGH